MQYAREHHFPNPTFFVDDGVSGVTYDRPGFQAMLAEIEAGRVAVAIAKDLSRLGRNSALTGLYTNFTFPQNGVRFIAINDNYDTIDPNRVDNDFAGIKNWFNEFYARDTSRKIRAVQKAKGERGVPLTTNVPYGYVKDLENPRRWVVDPVAADVVKRIFDLCMKGRGPMQIANQLKADKVLTPSAYRALQGIKTPNKKPEDPCDWHSSTVVAILERREYTGCTVNFKTYTNSIWDKKQRENPMENRKIFYNTHPAIISLEVFDKVQEIRQQRHRRTATGKCNMFSGLVLCSECKQKLYYLTEEEQLALADIMEDLEVTPSLSQAVKLKDLSASHRLDPDTMYEVMEKPKANQRETVKLDADTLRRFFLDYTPKQMETAILRMLEEAERERQRQKILRRSRDDAR